jgi:hypothetical protein
MVRVGPTATLPLGFALPVVLALVSTTGCTRAPIPDPRTATAEYASAVARNDAAAVYSMLTDEAKVAYGMDGTRRLLADAKDEVLRQTKAITSERAQLRAVAEVPYVDGERAVLEVEGGKYRISAAAGLPFGAHTPAAALSELRRALAQRSYAVLMRVLSSDTRGALEGDMRTLVEGLERPDTLEVRVHGENAEVTVPGGHRVILKREAGVWRVHDFD